MTVPPHLLPRAYGRAHRILSVTPDTANYVLEDALGTPLAIVQMPEWLASRGGEEKLQRFLDDLLETPPLALVR